MVVFIEFRHVGMGLTEMLERDLVDSTRHFGRPLPELKGSCVYDGEDRLFTWLVVCKLRGREVEPLSEEIIVEVMDILWIDVSMRVMQLALGCLVHYNAEALVGTCFQSMWGETRRMLLSTLLFTPSLDTTCSTPSAYSTTLKLSFTVLV
jgi:hypothetical protein